jgi:uncharacterized coiled-coil DUF342 family protein
LKRYAPKWNGAAGGTMDLTNETELLLERIDSLDVALETIRAERDSLRDEVREIADELVVAEVERDQLRRDVFRLRLLLAQGTTED